MTVSSGLDFGACPVHGRPPHGLQACDRCERSLRVKRYRTIVVDPPWDHSDGTGVDVRGGGRVTGLPYNTMTIAAIEALPVYELSDNVNHDAHLYLWTTSRYLPASFRVLEAWGFRYTATLVWCKASRGWSTGGRFQNNVEFILFGNRPKRVARPNALIVTTYLAAAAEEAGVSRSEVDAAMGTTDMAGWWLSRIETRCAVPSWEKYEQIKRVVRAGDDMDGYVRELNARKGTERDETPQAVNTRWFQWSRGSHSAKPEAFMDMVESVSPAPRLEMFARRQRLGWDTWGNEALNHVEISA